MIEKVGVRIGQVWALIGTPPEAPRLPYIVSLFASPYNADAMKDRWTGRVDGRTAVVESYFLPDVDEWLLLWAGRS